MRAAGYLVNMERGLAGEPGPFYNYVLARNGLFLLAEGPLLKAAVCIAGAQVRGLLPLEEKVELPMGNIPRHIYDLAVSILYANRHQEYYVAVTWEGEYRLRVPRQDTSPSGVKYDRVPGTVLDIHSHGGMSAFFSATDDRDEQGLCLYMVVGRLHALIPEIEMRVGVYGYFAPVGIGKVFK